MLRVHSGSEWILAPGLQLGAMDNIIRANDKGDDTKDRAYMEGALSLKALKQRYLRAS